MCSFSSQLGLPLASRKLKPLLLPSSFKRLVVTYRRPILSPRERETVEGANAAAATFTAESDTFSVDQDGSPRSTRQLMMMGAQGATRTHPSHQMCGEFY